MAREEDIVKHSKGVFMTACSESTVMGEAGNGISQETVRAGVVWWAPEL